MPSAYGADTLRGQVVAAALAEAKRVGPRDFRVAPIAAAFKPRGVTRATCYRWVAQAVKEGTFGEQVAAHFLNRNEQKTESAQREVAIVAAALPTPVTAADVASCSAGEIINHLQTTIQTAIDVIQFSRRDDGSIRNAKLLLGASECLRRSLETAYRVSECFRDVKRVEAFHRMIIDEIAAESPACAKRIWDRLKQAGQRGIA